MRGLSALFLTLAGAVGVARAWTLLIKVFINSWKRLYFSGTIEMGARAGADIKPRAGVSDSKAGSLMAGFLQQTGGIIVGERRNKERK